MELLIVKVNKESKFLNCRYLVKKFDASLTEMRKRGLKKTPDADGENEIVLNFLRDIVAMFTRRSNDSRI